ncbi:hypothetical protein SAY87_008153 [Trapa incisa]|uniref:Aldehyde dehydrogenase domain-containing protein n=1 Tax=Trapa incisa TaxID=236973 RepID=A0AAN7KG85_9MYRT|nr:hypothetical protein SAY87_008153 [Trapa incisa]
MKGSCARVRLLVIMMMIIVLLGPAESSRHLPRRPAKGHGHGHHRSSQTKTGNDGFANFRQDATTSQWDDQSPDPEFTKLFINGSFADSIRNGEVIARRDEGDAEDVEVAVKAAREAFDDRPWPRMSGWQRARIMHKFADLIEENLEELAALDSIEGGSCSYGASLWI